jgi:hypothetical protein
LEVRVIDLLPRFASEPIQIVGIARIALLAEAAALNTLFQEFFEREIPSDVAIDVGLKIPQLTDLQHIYLYEPTGTHWARLVSGL